MSRQLTKSAASDRRDRCTGALVSLGCEHVTAQSSHDDDCPSGAKLSKPARWDAKHRMRLFREHRHVATSKSSAGQGLRGGSDTGGRGCP
jgi:hypothetical protein